MKVFERLSALSDETIKEITMTYVFGGWECIPRHVRSSIEDFLHEVFECRADRVKVENMYDTYVRGFYRGFEVIADILCRVIKDEDRIPFWYVYEKAARQENRKGFDPVNHPDHNLMKEAKELGICKDVIRYAGDLDIDDANAIAEDDSLNMSAKLYRLNKLLIKSRTFGVITESDVQRKFDAHVRGLIEAIGGLGHIEGVQANDVFAPVQDKAKEYVEESVEPVTSTNVVEEDTLLEEEPETDDNGKTKELTPEEKKVREFRLQTRMENAALRYGSLFADVSRHLVQEEVLTQNGDNYTLVDDSNDLFCYIGLQIHKHTKKKYGENGGGKIEWDYFRLRLSKPNIDNPAIQRSRVKINSGYSVIHQYSVDQAIRKYSK